MNEDGERVDSDNSEFEGPLEEGVCGPEDRNVFRCAFKKIFQCSVGAKWDGFFETFRPAGAPLFLSSW